MYVHCADCVLCLSQQGTGGSKRGLTCEWPCLTSMTSNSLSGSDSQIQTLRKGEHKFGQRRPTLPSTLKLAAGYTLQQ